jgi:ATP-dependent exoDNAse (exonuclease V) beta subunit
MHLGIEMVMNGAEAEVPDETKDSIEWKYFWNYWNEDCVTWEPWRTEWEVWDEELKLAGSIDMVYRNKKDGTFAIYDWKRSKEIKMENSWGDGYGPVSHLPDCNYWHYTLQLNTYRWFLETYYGLRISDMYIVIFHPNNTNYRRFRLNRLDEEVKGMLAARLRAVKAGVAGVLL